MGKIVLDAILLGIGLAMDAACVSMTNGLTDKKMKVRRMLLIAFFFGFFQFGMPLIGYFAGSIFTQYISKFIPYIALILLGFLGGKMLWEAIKKKDQEQVEEKKLSILELFVQAIATSIDALTVGVLYVGESVSTALIVFGIVGVITFLISMLALWIGKKFGTLLNHKAEILGGIVLIGLGIKIFVESFFK